MLYAKYILSGIIMSAVILGVLAIVTPGTTSSEMIKTVFLVTGALALVAVRRRISHRSALVEEEAGHKSSV